eukprot:4861157-Pleurochrysis_carterae.AAC.1
MIAFNSMVYSRPIATLLDSPSAKHLLYVAIKAVAMGSVRIGRASEGWPRVHTAPLRLVCIASERVFRSYILDIVGRAKAKPVWPQTDLLLSDENGDLPTVKAGFHNVLAQGDCTLQRTDGTRAIVRVIISCVWPLPWLRSNTEVKEYRFSMSRRAREMVEREFSFESLFAKAKGGFEE